MKEKTGKILAELPVDVATYLLNEKRQTIRDIEMRQGIAILLVPNPALQTPHFSIQRVRSDETSHDAYTQPSYQLASSVDQTLEFVTAPAKPTAEEPAVRGIAPPTPAPAARAPERQREPGFIKRLWDNLFGGEEKAEQAVGQRRQRSAGHRSGGERAGGESSGRRRASPRRGGHQPSRRAQSQARQANAPQTPARQARGKPAARSPERPASQPADDAAEAKNRAESSRSSPRRGRRGGRGRQREPAAPVTAGPSGTAQGAESAENAPARHMGQAESTPAGGQPAAQAPAEKPAEAGDGRPRQSRGRRRGSRGRRQQDRAQVEGPPASQGGGENAVSGHAGLKNAQADQQPSAEPRAREAAEPTVTARPEEAHAAGGTTQAPMNKAAPHGSSSVGAEPTVLDPSTKERSGDTPATSAGDAGSDGDAPRPPREREAAS